MSESRQKPDARTPREMNPWARMFVHAVRGVLVAVGREPNFLVHGAAAAAVVALGAWLELSAERWALLALCIALVLTAEIVNTAIEHLARAITPSQHPEIRDALDVASGAVLVATIGAVVVGVVLLGPPLVAALR
jgi:diacylglycerol kinase